MGLSCEFVLKWHLPIRMSREVERTRVRAMGDLKCEKRILTRLILHLHSNYIYINQFLNRYNIVITTLTSPYKTTWPVVFWYFGSDSCRASKICWWCCGKLITCISTQNFSIFTIATLFTPR